MKNKKIVYQSVKNKVENKHKNVWLDCHVVKSYYFRYTFFWVKYQGFGCK